MPKETSEKNDDARFPRDDGTIARHDLDHPRDQHEADAWEKAFNAIRPRFEAEIGADVISAAKAANK